MGICKAQGGSGASQHAVLSGQPRSTCRVAGDLEGKPKRQVLGRGQYIDKPKPIIGPIQGLHKDAQGLG